MKALSLLFFLGLLTSCHTLDQVLMQTDRHADPFLVHEEEIDTRDVKVWVDDLSLTEYIHSSPPGVWDSLIWIDSVYEQFGAWSAAKYPDGSIRLKSVNFDKCKNIKIQLGTLHLNHKTLLSEIEERYPVAFARRLPQTHSSWQWFTTVDYDEVTIPDVSGKGVLTLNFQDGALMEADIRYHDEQVRIDRLEAYFEAEDG